MLKLRGTAAAVLANAALVTSLPLQTLGGQLLGTSFGIPGVPAEYDYVVVGAGCAGLTVAARLAEDPSVSVAIIEAGSFYEISNGNLSQVPATATEYIGKDPQDFQPGIDWGFLTTPQEGATNESVHYARGKTFGGSTSRNIMTYHAFTEGFHQRWAELVNDTSYGFDEMWPYFMKHMNHTPPDYSKRFSNTTVDYNATRLGTHGPVEVIYPNWTGAFATYVKDAMDDVGIHPIDGFESGRLIGGAWALATIQFDSNVRESSETAYLWSSVAEPENHLTVYPSTMAKRILFDDGNRATGVEVDFMGLTYELSARKEVIVSAGSFQSPQLLMVSGIGPSEKLIPHGIDVRVELSGVGENMWDHVLFGPSMEVDVVTQTKTSNAEFLAQAVQEFNEDHAGILTNPGVDYFGWEKVSNLSVASTFTNSSRHDLAQFPADWPEVEYICPGAVFGLAQDFTRDAPTDGLSYGSIIAAIVAPLSRGTVSISSADTYDQPIIDPRWLTHPTDAQVAIAAFKRARSIWAAPSLAEIVIGDEYFPGKDIETDEQILQLIRRAMTPVSHASCTCKMGTSDDPMAVIDNKARVFGTQGLRVIDASSFPILGPGHPMATIYALAEKLADDIKAAATW